MRPPAPVLTLAVAALVLVGCSGDELGSTIGSAVDASTSEHSAVGDDASGAPASEPAVTTAGGQVDVDPTTVPDVITPAYAQAVYAANIAAFAEVLDVVLHPEQGEAPADGGVGIVSSVASGDARDQLLETLDRARTDGGGDRFDGPRYVGPRLTDTTPLYAGPDCLIVAARLDFTDSGAVGGVTEALTAFSFVRRPDAVDGPSAWLLTKQLANDGPEGANPDEVLLEATLADFGELLEHDCEESDDAR